MKNNLKKLVVLLSTLVSVSNAAVTWTGVALLNVQGSGPTPTDLASNRLALFIVDQDDDGFLNGSIIADGIKNNLLVASDPGLSSSVSNLNVGGFFGGDLIIGRLATTNAFGDTTVSGAVSNYTAANILNRKFAIVWFDTPNTSTGNAAAGTKYGIARGGDWVVPAADSGTQTFGTANTHRDQVTLGLDASSPSTGGLVDFATNGTTFSVVPETSTTLLGALGALAMLRRRRR